MADSTVSQRLDALCARAWEAGGTGGGGAAPAELRLNEQETYELLDVAGVARCPSAFLPCRSRADVQQWARAVVLLAQPAGKAVLKIAGREILHKSDVGGVRVLDLPPSEAEAADALSKAAAQLRDRVGARVPAARIEGVLGCAFVPHRANQPGQELLLSLRQDPAFGPVVVVGIGGLLTEWYGKASAGGSRLILPAAGLDEAAVAAALSAHPALALAVAPSRLHARPPLQLAAAARTAAALAALARELAAAAPLPWTLEELEVNPAVAVDGTLMAIDGLGLISRRKWPQPRRPLHKIGALLAPRSAAVLGASAKGANPGRIILGNLRRSQSVAPDSLWVVHAQEKSIDGTPCVPEVAALPGKVDLAVVAVPAESAPAAIGQLVSRDLAESIILIPGGFAETGATGLAETIEALLREAHERPGGGPIMVGGNCLGIVSRDRYNTFFLPPYKLPFSPGAGENLALVSQSGAYLVTFASNHDGVIHPKASISFGNQMDLTVADFLIHYLEDPEIDVIACYIEGFRPGDGARFVAAASAARAAGKRVIVFKAGKTELGARAAASHTASLAGDYDTARACLEAGGAAVAATLDEFEDLIRIFTLLHRRPAGGNRVGIISNAGFECTAVVDALSGLEPARFDAATLSALDACLPAYAHRDNPVDATPIADTAAFARACEAILACPTVDCAILSTVPVTPALDNLPRDQAGRHGENLAGEDSQAGRMIRLWRATPKPAVAVIDSGRLYDPLAVALEGAGLPVFRKIDRAARALAAHCRTSVH